MKKSKDRTSSLLADRRRAKAHRAMILGLKSKPCADCKTEWPHYVMEFDHCRGEKLFSIADGAWKSLARLLAEIAKCDLVCSNCHKVRTHKRKKRGR